jgi:hypothetical protein
MLDTALGVVDESALDNLPRPNKRNQFKSLHKQRKQRGLDEQGMGEGSENFNGIDISMEKEDDEIMVRATAGGRELGHVLFVEEGEYLMPQDLEVEERFQGQGIAAAMYDYVKSKGYKIRRSGQQTDAGAGFWDKHKLGKNIWEQDVAEASLGNVLSWPEVVNKVSSAMKATGWKVQRQGENAFMFTTKGQETDDQWYIAMISNVGEGFFAYALGTVEEGDPHIDDAYRGQLPTTEASVSELMNEIRDGFGLNESVAEAAKKCPPATQDITLNLENRQKAIDEYGYGPLNPDLPNTKFWMKKVDEWNLDSMEEAQQSLCGNCAAFDVRQDTLNCIAQGIDSDVYSVTSWSELAREGVACEKRELSGDTKREIPFVTQQLTTSQGPIIAATDYVRSVPESIRAFVPNGRRYVTLGTDGFGRSDTRAALRAYFNVDAASIVKTALSTLHSAFPHIDR